MLNKVGDNYLSNYRLSVGLNKKNLTHDIFHFCHVDVCSYLLTMKSYLQLSAGPIFYETLKLITILLVVKFGKVYRIRDIYYNDQYDITIEEKGVLLKLNYEQGHSIL